MCANELDYRLFASERHRAHCLWESHASPGLKGEIPGIPCLPMLSFDMTLNPSGEQLCLAK